MKKLLMTPIVCFAFACTNPEHNVDNPGDTAGLNFKANDEFNTVPGPMSEDEHTKGLDTSHIPNDTARKILE